MSAMKKNNTRNMISPYYLFGKNYYSKKHKINNEYINFDSENNSTTHSTKFGLVSLYNNEVYIGDSYKKGKYWDEDTLLLLKQYIPSNKNIIEIGAHCGTSTLVYASFIEDTYKCYAFEPQKNIYNLLIKNIDQNNLQNKVIPFNFGVFCFEGNGNMNDIDLDGGGGNVNKRYNEENNLDCNFGGIGLGKNGESIKLVTLDGMNFNNIGFIHCDAQGAENFIFSKALRIIETNRPVIYFENNQTYGTYLYNNVCHSYPNYVEESKFRIDEYCMNKLGYKKCIHRFNNSIDTLLIP
jgi:FkbM family methyltransferase